MDIARRDVFSAGAGMSTHSSGGWLATSIHTPWIVILRTIAPPLEWAAQLVGGRLARQNERRRRVEIAPHFVFRLAPMLQRVLRIDTEAPVQFISTFRYLPLHFEQAIRSRIRGIHRTAKDIRSSGADKSGELPLLVNPSRPNGLPAV